MKKIVLFLTAVLATAGVFNYSNSASAGSSAQSMIIIETSANKILYEHNAYQKLAMASTTKVMTAIVVLENCRLKDIVKVDEKAAGVEGSSIYLQKDEELTIEQLLYGLMLQSGNDCATALAIHTAGSIEAFSEMMNAKAKKIGALDSNFMNPHGLDHKDHYTTAYDLAIISSYGMKNEDFARIVGTKKVEIPWAGRDYNRVVYNKNKILNQYQGGTGIKTGFTKKAGRCLVSSAKRDGMELVCVVLNCGPMFETSMEYMDMVFKKYHIQVFIEPYQYLGDTKIFNGAETTVGLYTRSGFKYPVKNDDKDFSTVIEIDQNLIAPVQKDVLAGKIKIYHKNDLIFCGKIYTINGAESLSFFLYINRLIKNWVIYR